MLSATEKKKKRRIIESSSDDDSIENKKESVFNDTSDDDSTTDRKSNLKLEFKKGISKLKKINQSEKTNKNLAKEKISTNEKETTVNEQDIQPNGDLEYSIEKQYSLSDGKVLPLIFDWKFCTNNTKKCNGLKKTYKYCLGVFNVTYLILSLVRCNHLPRRNSKNLLLVKHNVQHTYVTLLIWFVGALLSLLTIRMNGF